MRTIRSFWWIYFVLLVSSVSVGAGAAGPAWYAGTWDSTLHLDAGHPRTAAIRMELLDRDTRLPVRGVNVSLEGEYWEAWLNQSILDAQNYPGWNVYVDSEKREPRRKEFRLGAVSDSQGIVVFSLNWRKEFPWDSKVCDKRTYSADEWIIYFDDIEKVERLEIRHPRYKYVEAPLNFRHLVDLESYKDTSEHGYTKEHKFEALWKREARQKNVRLCILNLGDEFQDRDNGSSERPEFFEAIRDKNYGLTYRDTDNLPNLGDRHKCGPYFVYDLGEILLEPIAARVSVERIGSSILTQDTSGDETPWYSQYSRGPGTVFPHQNFATGAGMPDSPAASTERPEPNSIGLGPSANGASPTRTIDLGNGISMELVLIPAGTFYMGSSTSESGKADEGPVRRVQITKPFYMSKYEVTQDQYMAVTGENPSHFSGRNLPVDTVSWDDAVAFCDKVGNGARLPTEAEWEYACRAESETLFCFGDSAGGLGDYGWHIENSGSQTHAVGQKKPNAFGLHDMHGNLWEWCSDWQADSYRNAESVNPVGPSSGEFRVLRGGCWFYAAWGCRSAVRYGLAPDYSDFDLGFRIVLDI